MLIDALDGVATDPGYLRWMESHQLPDGRFALDPEGRASDEATRLARVALKAALTSHADAGLDPILARIPVDDWHLWLVKVLGALAGQYEWARVPPPRVAEALGSVIEPLTRLLPEATRAKLRPPRHMSPPVSLFYRPAFRRLFVAEQFTLAPMLLLIEAHTRKRERVLSDLAAWILARQAGDGSWFCVTFITALATMALMVARDAVPSERVEGPLARATRWLAGTRNDDGGHREAVSLNVWDTALATLALLRLGERATSGPVRAAVAWLAAAQHSDGGWAFHALTGPGLLPDADDTALATLALHRAGGHAEAVRRGAEWLRPKQARDGSWSTYVPEAGDVGCVSVTAHAVETMDALGDARAAGRGADWLERAQARDGSWDDLWLAKRTYGTSAALIALSQMGRGSDDPARRGMRWLAAARNGDGGWGETQLGEPAASTAEQTAFALQALRALGQEDADAAAWLHDAQREDGSWPASPIGIYWEVIGGYANPMNACVFPALALTQTAAS
jgi:squalene cyclase